MGNAPQVAVMFLARLAAPDQCSHFLNLSFNIWAGR